MAPLNCRPCRRRNLLLRRPFSVAMMLLNGLDRHDMEWVTSGLFVGHLLLLALGSQSSVRPRLLSASHDGAMAMPDGFIYCIAFAI